MRGDTLKYIKVFLFALIILILGGGLWLGHAIKPSSTLAQSDRQVNRDLGPEDLDLENTVNPFRGDDILHVLVLGVDKTALGKQNAKEGDMSRSDTMMLVSLDPKRERVMVLSLPRDTYVQIPGDPKKTKLGHAYAFGKHRLAMETVEDFLDIGIDYYVTVNYDAVRRLVDAMGGIEVDIPVDYSHKDSFGEEISFKKGPQVIRGNQAVHYLRMRKIYKDADLARIQNQQGFLLTVFDKAKTPAMIFKIPELIDIAMDNVETNFNYGQIAYLAQFGLGLDRDQIVMDTLVGEKDVRIEGLSYYVVDPQVARDQIEEFEKGGSPKFYKEKFGSKILVDPAKGHAYIGE